jgi:hypothetical protein
MPASRIHGRSEQRRGDSVSNQTPKPQVAAQWPSRASRVSKAILSKNVARLEHALPTTPPRASEENWSRWCGLEPASAAFQLRGQAKAGHVPTSSEPRGSENEGELECFKQDKGG